MSKRYARFLTAVFCLFLGGLMVWQMLLPDRERSDVENRTLQQRPALTLSSVLDGSYMEDVEAYVQDQFPPAGPVDGPEGPDGAADRQTAVQQHLSL